ncbi:3-phosphoshikimate 1-carboxyvinyltransferase [bacterium]|nr:3-phosphoshikimate 1-carboxyvinyltransferase [bacterium]
MNLIIEKTQSLQGEAFIPGSKSQTIRGIIFGSLAKGTSEIKNPLISADTLAAVNGCRDLGAKIDVSNNNSWVVEGFDGNPFQPYKILDLGNSGTSLNLLTGISSLGNFKVTLNGDSSLRQRPLQPLLDALNTLGAKAISVNNNSCPPIEITGKIKGGRTKVDGISSQFVSSLLITTPLAERNTQIEVVNIHEKPYIDMTLNWLNEQNIRYEKSDDLTFFNIEGSQHYSSFIKNIPGDWSSATFLIVAGAITKSDILLKGLDINDTQGDKEVIKYLEKMGADIKVEAEGIRIKGRELTGTDIDLNNTPDALPALAVVGCFAKGTTTLCNVAHARIKETDRIKVMTQELIKMGADIRETQDGMIIKQSNLKGTTVDGHYDHRVIMALSLAGLISEGKTSISSSEAINITFPTFVKLMESLGAKIKMEV